MESMKEWRLTVGEAAIRLGGRTEGVLWPKLEASVGGFEVAVWRTLGGTDNPDRTEFIVWLSGWPTTSGLDLRPTLRSILRWPIIRERYIWFDDADWDDAFVVRATDPDMVRLQLNGERRAAIKSWFDTEDTIEKSRLLGSTSRQVHTTLIKEGGVRSSPAGMVTGIRFVSRIEKLVELAKIITQ